MRRPGPEGWLDSQHRGGRPSSVSACPYAAKELDLSTIWLFSSCSASELRKIRSSLDEVTVTAGKIITVEGAVEREFFIIVDGKATVSRNGRTVAKLGPGSYFGELALLDRKPRSATVTSDTESLLLVLGQRQFNGMINAVPSLAHKLLAAMADRLREADAKAFY